MAVLCTKCGGTNVSCEAIINPNTKELKDFVEEAFHDGWCNNCGADAILTDVEAVQEEIEKKYREFVAKHHREPEFAECHIIWKDDNNHYRVKIQLSPDTNPEEDDDIFFYCRNLEELKSLATFKPEDFTVTKCYSFE